MGKEKGLLTKEVEGLIIEGLDKVITGSRVNEVTSDAIIRLFVPMIDNKIGDKIKDEIKLPIRAIGQFIVDKNYEDAIMQIKDILNKLVDIPGVSEDVEEQIATKQFEVFLLIMKEILDRKKNE
jgi:hypothetical protein